MYPAGALGLLSPNPGSGPNPLDATLAPPPTLGDSSDGGTIGLLADSCDRISPPLFIDEVLARPPENPNNRSSFAVCVSVIADVGWAIAEVGRAARAGEGGRMGDDVIASFEASGTELDVATRIGSDGRRGCCDWLKDEMDVRDVVGDIR